MTTKTEKKRNRGANGSQGMKWIRSERRLAIYLRDNLCCLWCGRSVEDEGVKLTLDHVVSRTLGGSNKSSNLITCCLTCNARRQSTSRRLFAQLVAAERVDSNATAIDILKNISRHTRRRVDTRAASTIIRARGSFLAALQHAREA